ncbi:pilus assembly protein PilY [Dyella monticola]|uniref:Pilus assembly protein PilY n=1 Tax=Dyella monticola TaxID=1927958 RepID=A0A370X935_9GAMM|nr:PilC/PilY family type IV pilus protein [Dyella monticola]RDS84745.1 pilus assembly protein PilY [Dyella monticola]
MKTLRLLSIAAVLGCLVLSVPATQAQTVSENFTGSTSNNQWYSFNGACLTAGSNAVGSLYIPSCTNNSSYFTGVGASAPTADAANNGALLLTSGANSENGGIISVTPFSSSQGVQITFTTYTFGGNSGGTFSDGADGIGFYLIDGSYSSQIQQTYNDLTTHNTNCGGSQCTITSTQLPWYFGAWGGSLGYSCSNTNNPYNGMTGAYLGLGIDEFGNFLNGGASTLNSSGDITSSYDNTNTGDASNGTDGGSGNYQPGRIGLRGYGDVNIGRLLADGGTSAMADSNSGNTPNTTDVQAVCESGGTYKYNTPTVYSYSYTYTTGSGHSATTNSYTGSLYQRSGSSRNGYTYSAKGSTVSGTTTSTSNGYTGSGTPYGAVQSGSGSNATTTYYAITATQNVATASTVATDTIPDYAVIPSAYHILPSNTPIANESATSRVGTTVATSAVPISYALTITQNGLLTLKYSYNSGNYVTVLNQQNITSSNGTIPSTFLFGFGGSTGGSNNYHEITCFQATPANIAASSAGINVQQTAQVESGTQIYLAYYHSDNWWGQLEALTLNANSDGSVSIASTANWDASCVLTGGACTSTGATTGTAQSSRLLLTSSGSGLGGGINFSNSSFPSGDAAAFGTLTTAEQNALNSGDNLGSLRLAYLSGDRTNEYVNSSGDFRARTSVLGDIMDSSPTWVGAPSTDYPDTWKDLLNSGDSLPENSGTQVYSGFESQQASRLDVVYEGSNDGFMHGFEAGSYNSSGVYSSTNNDGKEVIAYMPAAAMLNIHNTSENGVMDFSNTSYAHNFFVDATPGTGDLFYNNVWHTWLASGLGAGGNAIFILDITNPSSFSTNGTSSVIGEWNASNITCANVTNCGNNLGQTYGTPQIRRFHNGEWGVIFGNGLNSSTGDAGIYVMLFSYGSSGLSVDKTVYLDTGVGSASGVGHNTGPNGIAYVTPVDLDGDHVTDYVYAGDLYGNVWRFDLTNADPTKWGITTYPNTTNGALFTTPQTSYTSGSTTAYDVQPISTQVSVLAVASTSGSTPRVMVEFGTGLVTPQTASSGIQYATGQQALYGIWDWKQGVSGTAGAAYAGLATSAAPSAAITTSTLQSQTLTTLSTAGSGVIQGYRTVTNNTVCFAGTTCNDGSSGTQFGWYENLPGYLGVTSVGGANQTEQVIYNPVELDGAFLVDTTIPANNSPLTCSALSVSGWTLALNPANGGLFTNSFFDEPAGTSTPIAGVALGATGSASIVSVNQQANLVAQTVNGTGAAVPVNPPPPANGVRLNWIQLH